MAAPIVAPPTRNETQDTIAVGHTYTRGTSTTITLTDGTGFPNSAHVIRIRNADNTKWCLVIYSTYAANVLTLAAADDYALAKNVTVGDETYEWPAGSIVELVCAADEIGQIMNPIADANAGEIFFEASGVLESSTGLVWDDTDKQLIVTKAAIGATQGDYGLKLVNTTDAAAGAQQYSPPLIMQGEGWKTDATAATQPVAFRQFVRPIQGAAAPTGAWDLQASINGGAYSDLVTVLSNGYVGVGTTSPTTQMHIYNAINAYLTIEGYSSNAHLFLNSGTDGVGGEDSGVIMQANGVSKWTFYKNATDGFALYDYAASKEILTVVGNGGLTFNPATNTGFGTATFDGTAVGCVAIANGTEPAAHTDNQIYLYSKDATAGGSTLGLYTEYGVEDVGTFTPAKKGRIWWNGVEYYIQLDPV